MTLRRSSPLRAKKPTKKRKVPDEVMAWFREMGARGGLARAANLSAERRREIAVQAAQARWKKAVDPA